MGSDCLDFTRWRAIAVAAGVALLLTYFPLPALAADSVWLHDFETAEAASRRLERPLLIHFYASWCGPCRKMEAEVLHSIPLQRQLAANFVAVKVDIDAHPELGRRFRIEALPHDIVVSPTGKILGRMEGFQPQQRYLASLSRLVPARPPTERPLVADDDSPTAPPPRTRSVATDGQTPTVRLNAVEPVIGLDGYCPVTLWGTRTWTRGAAQLTAEFQGVTFRFVGAAEKEEFERSPQKFAPRLLGCDPVVLWDTERAIAGSSRFGAYFDGELYLFSSSETRRRFRAQPERYIRTRQVQVWEIQRR